MLFIDPSLFVAKGKHRECYEHPQNKNLCIKVLLPSKSGSSLTEAEREASYYRFLMKKNTPWTMLPAFHGEIITDRGKGYVFDLIRDFDDTISKNLDYYLSNPNLTKEQINCLSNALDQLSNYLLRWNIITMNIHSRNIVYQRLSNDNGRLVIVDDVGNSDFIPCASYISCLARLKIKRKWRRFLFFLLKEYPGNKFLKSKISV